MQAFNTAAPLLKSKGILRGYSSIFDIGIFLILTGLVFSRFALSVGLIILFLDSVFSGHLKKNIKKFLQNRFLILLASIFLVYLITGLYSSDKSYFFERIRIALPMLILPFSFANREGTDHDQLNKWLFLFFVPVSLTAIYSAAALFCRHSSFSIVFDENTHLITPINHVRYSLMVAFCIFIGIHLLRSNWLKSSFQKYLSLFFTLFLVVYLHFISVRSGLLGFYLVCFFYVIKAFMLLRIRKALVLSVLLAGLVLSASQIIPGFKHKLVVSKESVLAYASGEPIQSLSDNWRFRSIEAGLAIGTRDWLLGVGLGDLKNAMKVELEKVGKKGIKLLLPHNQFVFVFAFSGILGLCLFCFVLFKAVYIGSASGLPLFWHLNVIVLSSFLFDTTIETQVGLVFWVFFSLLLSRK